MAECTFNTVSSNLDKTAVNGKRTAVYDSIVTLAVAGVRFASKYEGDRAGSRTASGKRCGVGNDKLALNSDHILIPYVSSVGKSETVKIKSIAAIKYDRSIKLDVHEKNDLRTVLKSLCKSGVSVTVCSSNCDKLRKCFLALGVCTSGAIKMCGVTGCIECRSLSFNRYEVVTESVNVINLGSNTTSITGLGCVTLSCTSGLGNLLGKLSTYVVYKRHRSCNELRNVNLACIASGNVRSLVSTDGNVVAVSTHIILGSVHLCEEGTELFIKSPNSLGRSILNVSVATANLDVEVVRGCTTHEVEIITAVSFLCVNVNSTGNIVHVCCSEVVIAHRTLEEVCSTLVLLVHTKLEGRCGNEVLATSITLSVKAGVLMSKSLNLVTVVGITTRTGVNSVTCRGTSRSYGLACFMLMNMNGFAVKNNVTNLRGIDDFLHFTINVCTVVYCDSSINCMNTVLIYVIRINVRNVEGTILDLCIEVSSDQTVRTVTLNGTTGKLTACRRAGHCCPTDNGTILIKNGCARGNAIEVKCINAGSLEGYVLKYESALSISPSLSVAALDVKVLKSNVIKSAGKCALEENVTKTYDLNTGCKTDILGECISTFLNVDLRICNLCVCNKIINVVYKYPTALGIESATSRAEVVNVIVSNSCALGRAARTLLRLGAGCISKVVIVNSCSILTTRQATQSINSTVKNGSSKIDCLLRTVVKYNVSCSSGKCELPKVILTLNLFHISAGPRVGRTAPIIALYGSPFSGRYINVNSFVSVSVNELAVCRNLKVRRLLAGIVVEDALVANRNVKIVKTIFIHCLNLCARPSNNRSVCARIPSVAVYVSPVSVIVAINSNRFLCCTCGDSYYCKAHQNSHQNQESN